MSMAAAGHAEPRLEVILGRCDPLRAEVYFRATLPPGIDPAAVTLTGTISGPECRRAVTLPATAPLRPLPEPIPAAADGRLVARAVVTEPSPWTPEVPQLYRLEARLEHAGGTLATWRRRIGLRRLGVRGRSLWLDGRRYVPRAVAADPARIDLAGFSAAGLAAVVGDPSEAFLERADAEGVALFAVLAEGSGPGWVSTAAERLLRWVPHPAVLVAVVPRGIVDSDAAALADLSRGSRDTMLLASGVDGAEPCRVARPVGDLLVVELAGDALPCPAWRTNTPPGPLVARRIGEATAAPPSRRPCDELQAALAGWAVAAGGGFPDWAGYLVD